ncbi:MAG: AMP-binding protein, partial [Geminicoccaceae bacterium]
MARRTCDAQHEAARHLLCHGGLNMSPAPFGQDAALAARITVGELLRAQARMRPKSPAVVDRGRMWSYGEFNARVNRLAHVLTALGLQRGDRVAILSENRCEYLELAFAG